jgi:predicted ATPase
MIKRVKISDSSNLPVSWWPDVEAFQGRGEFVFENGLNILCGPNGSGKSTLLTMMAKYFMCEQGGIPKATTMSIGDLFRGLGSDDLLDGASFDHDGWGVCYQNPSNVVGMLGSSFDDDFFMEGVRNLATRASVGETSLMGFDRICEHIVDNAELLGVEEFRRSVNDLWVNRLDAMEKGQQTLFLDEPERSFDISHLIYFWKVMKSISKNFQVIIASHSVLSLDIPGANYIELEEGYVDRCRSELADVLLP